MTSTLVILSWVLLVKFVVYSVYHTVALHLIFKKTQASYRYDLKTRPPILIIFWLYTSIWRDPLPVISGYWKTAKLVRYAYANRN